MSAKVTYPTRSLLQGMPYVPAASTDLRARFKAIQEAAKKPKPIITQLRHRK